MRKEKEHLFFEEVFSKLVRYCAYQERSEQEVYFKAKEFTIDENLIADLLAQLKGERYLDDRRFSAAYVKGKINQKRWGRYKIREGLKSKGVANDIIQGALEGIDDQQYLTNLQKLIENQKVDFKNDVQAKGKLYRYLMSKGYESGVILEFLS